jgi:hypothetical protein
VCFIVCKTTLKLECTILATLYLAGTKSTDSWCARKGNLQRALLLDVSMVPSSALTVATDGERLTCYDFSVGKIVRLVINEFIAEYFGSREGGQTEVTVVEPLSALSPPTLDGVDRLYRRHQLTSHPGPHCDTRAGASNLKLTNRIARGGHNDDFRYTTEELHSITTPYATSNEATECLSPSKVGRRPQIAVRRGKKRCKQHPQGGMTMNDHDDGKAGRSGGGCIAVAMCNNKHQARLPTDHLKKLLEETCPTMRTLSGTSSRTRVS